MRPQSQMSRQQWRVDVNSLTADELRAYIADLDKQRKALIKKRYGGSQCSRCIHAQCCDLRSVEA